MITKETLKNFKKVGVSVWGEDGQKFPDGKQGRSFKVYDTTPEEVLNVIKKALENYSK